MQSSNKVITYGRERALTASSDPNRKSVGWIFTYFVPKKLARNFLKFTLKKFEKTDKNIECYVWQLEFTPTSHRLHVQGYIKWVHAVTFRKAQLTLPQGTHIANARGNRQQNHVYCTKQETRAPGFIPVEYGDFSNQQGNRTELQEISYKVKGKRKLSEIASDHPESWIRYNRGIKDLYNTLHSTGEGRNGSYEDWSDIHWYYGPTQVGKTSQVYLDHPNSVYVKDPKTKWWDGFDPLHHTAILLDDYPLSVPAEGVGFEVLLRLGHPFPFTGETKGGHIMLGSQKIYITSNHHPHYIFGDNDNWAALERRIELSTFCPAGPEIFKKIFGFSVEEKPEGWEENFSFF